MARVFLDANVFLYAIGGEGPQREACREVLKAVAGGKIEGVTSSEVLQEILHVRGRRLGTKDATSAVRSAAELVAEVLPVALVDILRACDLVNKYPKLGARDALHLAVMHNAEIETVVSVDKDLDAVKWLRRLSPQEAIGRLA